MTKQAIHYMRQGDLEPGIEVTPNNQALDYSLATSILFVMKTKAGVEVFSKTATVVTVGATKRLRYAFTTPDTATAGEFVGYFKANFAGSRPLSIPNFEDIAIVIRPS